MLLHFCELLQALALLKREIWPVALHIREQGLMPHDGHFSGFFAFFTDIALIDELAEESDKGVHDNSRERVLLGKESFQEKA